MIVWFKAGANFHYCLSCPQNYCSLRKWSKDRIVFCLTPRLSLNPWYTLYYSYCIKKESVNICKMKIAKKGRCVLCCCYTAVPGHFNVWNRCTSYLIWYLKPRYCTSQSDVINYEMERPSQRLMICKKGN